MVDTRRALTGGVDTHADVHVAVVIDPEGGLLGVKSFATDLAGYKLLSGWMGTFGEIGSGRGRRYRLLWGRPRPSPSSRGASSSSKSTGPTAKSGPGQGKSDSLDAIEAARAALSGTRLRRRQDPRRQRRSHPRPHGGAAQRRESRTKAINQIRQLVYTAPDELRERFVGVPPWRIAEGVAILRVHADADPVRMATKSALGTLGRRRAVALGEEGKRLDVLIARLVAQGGPRTRRAVGLGPDTAALLLIAAGDNPSRLRSEATWAKLCGVAPRSFLGKVTRHRLNRGGDRQANHALWRIVLTRMSCHDPTKVYVARRTAEGKSKREIMRILKRYVAREVYHYLPRD